jgi:hypothetical protein
MPIGSEDWHAATDAALTDADERNIEQSRLLRRLLERWVTRTCRRRRRRCCC